MIFSKIRQKCKKMPKFKKILDNVFFCLHLGVENVYFEEENNVKNRILSTGFGNGTRF